MLSKISKKLNNINLFSKLMICFITIIVLPLTIVYYYSYNSISNIMISNTYKDTLKSLNIISKDLDNIFNNMISTCIYVNNDYNIENFLLNRPVTSKISETDKKVALIEYINNLNRFFYNITNINFTKKVYFTLLSSDGIRYTNWEQEYLRDNEYIGQYLKDYNSSNYNVQWKNIEENYVAAERKSYPYVVTLAKDLTGTNNYKKYGDFIVSIPEKELRRTMLGNDNNARRFIVCEDKIISAYDDAFVNKNIYEMFKCRIPNKDEGFFINENLNGQKDLFMYYKILNTNYYLVDIKSYDIFISSINKERDRLLFIYFICILIFTFTAWIISKNLSTPLIELAKEMKNLDIDTQGSRVKIKRSDEIGILQKSFSRMKIDIKSLMDENIEKERKKRSAELEMLQAQISPHFLFNTLNSIRWAAINNNTEKAANMVLSLVKLLRMTINKEGEFISIGEEIENVNNYVSILQMRHSFKIGLELMVDEQLKSYRMPRLLLQPIVENSIIHGTSDENNEIMIKIKVYKMEEKCITLIEDNGKGFDIEEMNHNRSKSIKFSGIGLNNVDERIKLYYGEAYGLQVSSEINKGTTVVIELPL
jgi:two-component system, sensor histidine kinase YesM